MRVVILLLANGVVAYSAGPGSTFNIAAEEGKASYVDLSRGSDSNPGTQGKPFKSIAKGIASGTEAVKIYPGIYKESNLKIVSAISLEGVGGANKVVVDGGNSGQLFFVDGSRFQKGKVAFSDMTLQNSNTTHDLLQLQKCGVLAKECFPDSPAKGHCPSNRTICVKLRGGAIHATDVALDLSNVIFTQNSATEAGALFMHQVAATLQNCAFIQNQVAPAAFVTWPSKHNASLPWDSWYGPKRGGAILAENSKLNIINGTFDSNQLAGMGFLGHDTTHTDLNVRGMGGAISLVNTTAMVANTHFFRNRLYTAGGVGSGCNLFGGAVHLNGTDAAFSETDFVENSVWIPQTVDLPGCSLRGAALYASASDLSEKMNPAASDDDDFYGDDDDIKPGFLDDDATGWKIDDDDGAHKGPHFRPVQHRHHKVSCAGCRFERNTVKSENPSYKMLFGSAIFAIGVEVLLNNTKIRENIGVHGTITLQAAYAVVNNSIIADNIANGTVDSSGGGALVSESSHTEFTSTAFARNTAPRGGALRFADFREAGTENHYRALAPRDRKTTHTSPWNTISGCQFHQNGIFDFTEPSTSDSKGGAIDMSGQEVVVRDSNFSGCGSAQGGAISVTVTTKSTGKDSAPAVRDEPALRVNNTVFSRNVANLLGDHVFVSHGSVVFNHSKVFFNGTYRPQITNSTPINISGGTQFICPNGSLTLFSGSSWQCQPCIAPQYTMAQGISVDGGEDLTRCHNCPFGTTCGTQATPKSLPPGVVPNMLSQSTTVNVTAGFFARVLWSGLTKNGETEWGSVGITHCTQGFCCPGDSCDFHEMCTGNRDSNSELCGACLENYTLAIDSPNCIPDHKCKAVHFYWIMQMLSWCAWGSYWHTVIDMINHL
jgi:hypothetical protein